MNNVWEATLICLPVSSEWESALARRCWSYPESVLRFDDGAVEDGGLHVVRNADDPRHLLTRGRRNGLAHFFDEVFGADVALAFRKEAVLPVHHVLGLDLAGRVVHNVSHDFQSLSCMTEGRQCLERPSRNK